MGRDSSLAKGARRWGGGPPCANPSYLRVNRRTKKVRKKKPGRSARNDGVRSEVRYGTAESRALSRSRSLARLGMTDKEGGENNKGATTAKVVAPYLN